MLGIKLEYTADSRWKGLGHTLRIFVPTLFAFQCLASKRTAASQADTVQDFSSVFVFYQEVDLCFYAFTWAISGQVLAVASPIKSQRSLSLTFDPFPIFNELFWVQLLALLMVGGKCRRLNTAAHWNVDYDHIFLFFSYGLYVYEKTKLPIYLLLRKESEKTKRKTNAYGFGHGNSSRRIQINMYLTASWLIH